MIMRQFYCNRTTVLCQILPIILPIMLPKSVAALGQSERRKFMIDEKISGIKRFAMSSVRAPILENASSIGSSHAQSLHWETLIQPGIFVEDVHKTEADSAD